MKSLMRLAKRKGNKDRTAISESGLGGTEAKYLQSTKEQLLGSEGKVAETNERVDEVRSQDDRGEKASSVGESAIALSQVVGIRPEEDLINRKLPRELIIRVFSYLDIVSLCRSACVSKVSGNYMKPVTCKG